MKTNRIIAFFFIILALASCIKSKVWIDFNVDSTEIHIGADGGKKTIRISSADNWIASTDAPWISISPVNGKASVECEILIDSALTDQSRVGYIRIENQNDWRKKEIKVSQDGYAYIIELDKTEINVENFAPYGERGFEVKVKTNVDFSVKIPDNAGWLRNESYKVKLDRGLRPRTVTVPFEWTVSSVPMERSAEVSFEPVSGETLARQDVLKVVQGAAEPIEENTRKGDSLALLGISRSIATWYSWENPEPMDNWPDVTLWEPGMDGYTPEKDGRVRSANFFLFGTKEGLPYEVQYLTAAEELSFFGNENSFLYSLDPGEYITKLTQLRRLTIAAYGLTTLPESFKNLKNLEYLSIQSNNFQRVPEVLTPENFPNLHAIILNANQRKTIYDLSNTVEVDFGGLYDEGGLPRRLLEWEKLDTLVLSVNYLQGSIPKMEDFEKYTEAEVMAADTLPRDLIGIPRVLPNMKHLAINLNRLTGTVPDWIMFHPKFNYWNPYTFIFSQEGKDEEGRNAGFDNEPDNLTYYYEFYKGFKKDNTVYEEDEVTNE